MKRKTVGGRIREAREEKGISSYELAKRAGLKPQTVLLAERGKTNPNLESCARICRVLDISLDWLALAFFDDEEDSEMF